MASDQQSPPQNPPPHQPPDPDELQHLITLLDEARAYTHAVLKSVDPADVVHPGSGWTVHDVVSHILAWENEALLAVRALASGGPAYTIPDFESFDATNAALRDQRRALPFDALLRELAELRQQFISALSAVPAERFDAVFDFPWPASGTVGMLVLIIAAHERGHAVEIARATAQT